VNWVKQPSTIPAKFTLEGRDASGITAELRTPEHSTGDVASLYANGHNATRGRFRRVIVSSWIMMKPSDY
jgi:hypothetical protein